MFLSISRFAVANTFDDPARDVFLARPHLVDVALGFIRLEVVNPCAAAKEFLLLAWWQDEGSFDTWHRSHAYDASHAGIPKGLKLAPGRTAMTRLQVFAA